MYGWVWPDLNEYGSDWICLGLIWLGLDVSLRNSLGLDGFVCICMGLDGSGWFLMGLAGSG